jgi:hypothetical protein
MSKKELLERVKAFGMTNQIITEEIQSVGLKFSHDFGDTQKDAADLETIYYRNSQRLFALKRPRCAVTMKLSIVLRRPSEP